MKYSRQWLKWLTSLSLATLISRILGFVREVVFAMIFGASAAFDGFITASRIPNMLRRLFAEGALTQAFVPVLTQLYVEESKASVRKFNSAILSLLLLTTSVIALIFIIFPEPIVSLYAWGFAYDDPRYAIACGLLPVLSIFLPLISIISFYSAVLNTHRRFFIAGILPGVSNVVLIACAWSMRTSDQGVYYLSWALVGGAVLQLLLVWVQSLHLLRGVGLTTRIFHPGVRRVLKMIMVGIFGLSASQISLFIDGNLASFLPVGSMSWLYYAERLIYLPLGTVGVSLASITLPGLSEAIIKDNVEQVKLEFHRSAHTIFLIGIPAAVGLFLVADPIISVLFERGAFTQHDTEMTALALQCFSLGLPFMMVVKVWIAAAYSYQRVDLTVKASLLSITVNLVVVLLTMPFLQHRSVALAVGLGAFVQAGYFYTKLTEVTGFKIVDFQRTKMFCIPILLLFLVISGFNTLYVHGMVHSAGWLIMTISGSIFVYFAAYFMVLRAL